MEGTIHEKELHLEGVINGEEYIRRRVPPGRSLHGEKYTWGRVTHREKLHREKSFTGKEISALGKQLRMGGVIHAEGLLYRS